MAGDVPTSKRAVLLAIFIAFGEFDDFYHSNARIDGLIGGKSLAVRDGTELDLLGRVSVRI